MSNRSGLSKKGSTEDTPEVDEAERKVAGVLGDLEDDTEDEVKDVDLEEVVDTDDQGRPEVKKAVDITVEHKPKKGWAR